MIFVGFESNQISFLKASFELIRHMLSCKIEFLADKYFNGPCKFESRENQGEVLKHLDHLIENLQITRRSLGLLPEWPNPPPAPLPFQDVPLADLGFGLPKQGSGDQVYDMTNTVCLICTCAFAFKFQSSETQICFEEFRRIPKEPTDPESFCSPSGSLEHLTL